MLFRYSSDLKTWKFLGTYLTGVANNPYPNGLSYANGIVHVSWTYRHFIHYDGAKDPNSTAHQAQAGPNGPENNADLCYAYSIDTGDSWLNSEGAGIADLTKAETILPSTRGITVFEISRGSGVLNQESQTIDSEGNFHVLNRQKDANGNERWYHYWRKSDGEWRSRPILSAKLSSGGLYGLEPTEAGPRGSLISKNGYLYVVIQGNRDSSLTLLRSPSSTDFESMEVVWTGDSFQGEPLFDESMLGNCESLSVFSIQGGKVVVLDFNIG